MALTLPSRPSIKRPKPHVGEIADPPAQRSISLLWGRIHDLEERLQQSEAANALLIAGHNTNATAIDTAYRAAKTALALTQTPGGAATSATDTGGAEELPGGGDGGGGAEGFAAAGATGHDSGGLLTAIRAGQIVGGTMHEFSGLMAPADAATRAANQLQLLLRIIWHLRTAGFSAGRQRNPSGAISGDKITVVIEDVLRVYDVFTGPPPSEPLVGLMRETAPPVMVDEAGTPD